MEFIKILWKKWLRVVHSIGSFQTQILFSLMYLTLFLPIGLWIRFFDNALEKKNKKKEKSNFSQWSYPKQTLEEIKNPY